MTLNCCGRPRHDAKLPRAFRPRHTGSGLGALGRCSGSGLRSPSRVRRPDTTLNCDRPDMTLNCCRQYCASDTLNRAERQRLPRQPYLGEWRCRTPKLETAATPEANAARTGRRHPWV
eukprot:3393531-Alexandrium_andersonii.AAC.2